MVPQLSSFSCTHLSAREQFRESPRYELQEPPSLGKPPCLLNIISQKQRQWENDWTQPGLHHPNQNQIIYFFLELPTMRLHKTISFFGPFNQETEAEGRPPSVSSQRNGRQFRGTCWPPGSHYLTQTRSGHKLRSKATWWGRVWRICFYKRQPPGRLEVARVHSEEEVHFWLVGGSSSMLCGPKI